jgi:hypothetical protein
MKKVLEWIKNNPNRAMFLVPIILVAVISISHVVTWYDIANPLNWAIYLSVAIEIAAMTALVAVSTRVKGGVWFMFSIVTLIQIIGNVFFCFKEIDENGELFKSWVELTLPIWDSLGTDVTDTVGMKRWLALLEGGLLPIISLTSLHFFVNYEKRKEENDSVSEEEVPWEEDPEVEEFLENEDNSDVYDSEEDKVHLVASMTNDKEGDFMKFQKKQDELIKKKPKKMDTTFGKVNKGIKKDAEGGSKNIQRID